MSLKKNRYSEVPVNLHLQMVRKKNSSRVTAVYVMTDVQKLTCSKRHKSIAIVVNKELPDGFIAYCQRCITSPWTRVVRDLIGGKR